MNQKILVISSYPPKDTTHASPTVGIASYTKNTLTHLPKDTQITVLAEILDGKKVNYKEENITVKRVWKRGSHNVFLNLLQEIDLPTKKIVIAFELSMFGGMFQLIDFVFFLLILRLAGKKTTIILHQVINSIDSVSGHINIKAKSLKSMVMNFLLRLFYIVIVLIVNNIIVFDQVLKDRLNSNKVVVIPHGVEKFNNIPSQSDARKKLILNPSSFILLYFGYIAWYKGTDLLTNFKFQISNFKLILAGGPNPNHTTKPFYMEYVRQVKDKARENNITVTGFVEEKEIPLYFEASDVVVLPYRTLMSASGPLSLAFSFGKPFLLSKELAPILDTKDIELLLSDLKIDKQHFLFDSQQQLEERLKQLKMNKKIYQSFSLLSGRIAKMRSWKNISNLYSHALFYES